MKVLHVIDKSFVGGGQTIVRNLIAEARGSAVEASLACRGGGPLVDDVRALGAKVTEIPFDKRFRPGPARALARVVHSGAIDLVHAHGLVATTYAVLARSFFGMRARLLYHQHGFHHRNYRAGSIGLRRAAEKLVCRRVDRVIACSRADRDQLIAEGYASPEAVELVYYGIPEPSASPELIERARADERVSAGQPVIGTVARLHPQKGIDVFLRAAAAVAHVRPDAAFVVVGTGELEQELHELGHDLGLNGELRWMGARPSAAFRSTFSVDVLSSRWEGLPFSLLESMASARPIVTTDVPGCLEAVGEEEAEIVPRDDPEALCGGILRLLSDPELARARAAAARRRFERDFTLKRMVGRVEELYAEVMR